MCPNQLCKATFEAIVKLNINTQLLFSRQESYWKDSRLSFPVLILLCLIFILSLQFCSLFAVISEIREEVTFSFFSAVKRLQVQELSSIVNLIAIGDFFFFLCVLPV